jgi:hypothetical protein
MTARRPSLTKPQGSTPVTGRFARAVAMVLVSPALLARFKFSFPAAPSIRPELSQPRSVRTVVHRSPINPLLALGS